jgi:hypothetical protein
MNRIMLIRSVLISSGDPCTRSHVCADHPALWDELRRVEPLRVATFAVRNNFYVVERPVYDPLGQLRYYIAGWCYSSYTAQRLGPRMFCVDMGGFAFDAELLQRIDPGTIWNYTGRSRVERVGWGDVRRTAHRKRRHRLEWRGGESEFVEQLLGPSAFPEDLQPLGNCGHDVLVFHNGFNQTWQWSERGGTVFCKGDGWPHQNSKLESTVLGL